MTQRSAADRTDRVSRLARLAATLCVAGAALFALCAPASAQIATAEQTRLLPRILRSPNDLDASLEYYRASVQAGDYEAAIGALDRLLFFNPALTRAKYELGTLYYRLGSYGQAAQYFRMALDSPDLDTETRNSIGAFLPEAEKQLEPSRLTAFVQAGYRVQSNASFIPDRLTIRLGGQDLLLSPANSRKGDSSVFVLVSISHDYDFQNQRGDTLETRFSGLATKQFKFGQYDLGLFDASFGPRLALNPDEWPGVSIKPYVAAGAAFVGGDYYTSSGGGGVTLRIPIAPILTIEPFVEARRADFVNGIFSPTATSNSGPAVVVGSLATARVTEDVTIEARTIFTNADARARFQSYQQYSGELAVSFRFDPPVDTIPFKWTFAPFGKVSWSDFDGPNPFIDPAVVRSDFEYRVGASMDMPITPNLGVSAALQYARFESNLPNYRTRNLSFLLGPTGRF